MLDACVGINLWAGDVFNELAGVTEVVVVEQVIAEVAFVDSSDGQRERIPWSVLVDRDVITMVSLRAAELASFLALASRLGDGEAASLAVASGRGLTLATDDALALRAARDVEPPVLTTTTPDVIRFWADAVDASDARLRGVVRDVARFARYRPPVAHPLYSWWREYAE